MNINSLENILSISQGDGNGFIILTQFALPVFAFGFAKEVLKFHREFFRDYHMRMLEKASGLFPRDSTEAKLLQELLGQEVFYRLTGLWLACSERERVLAWVTQRPITFRLLRSAWSQVQNQNHAIKPCLSWYDKIYMWWGFAAAIITFLFGACWGISNLEYILVKHAYGLLAVPAYMFLLSGGLLYLVLPYFDACRLIRRLKPKVEEDTDTNDNS